MHRYIGSGTVADLHGAENIDTPTKVRLFQNEKSRADEQESHTRQSHLGGAMRRVHGKKVTPIILGGLQIYLVLPASQGVGQQP